MPTSFLLSYAKEQFGFIPNQFTVGFVRTAKAAYQERNKP